MIFSIGLCNSETKSAIGHQCAVNFWQGVSFLPSADRLTSSKTQFHSELRQKLGKFTSNMSFKNTIGRQLCLNLSKYFSPLVWCLWSQLVAAHPKRKLYTFQLSQSSKKLQCPNTKLTPRQGLRPALTSARIIAAISKRCLKNRMVLALVSSPFCISPMNLPTASFKLVQIQTKRGLSC